MMTNETMISVSEAARLYRRLFLEMQSQATCGGEWPTQETAEKFIISLSEVIMNVALDIPDHNAIDDV